MNQQKTSLRIGNAEITVSDKGVIFNGFDGRLFTESEIQQLRAILTAAFRLWEYIPLENRRERAGFPPLYGDI